MRFLKLKETVPFMSWRYIAMGISTLVVLASLTSIFTKGMNWGLDFTGGTKVEVGFDEPVDLDKLRKVFEATQFSDAVPQLFGSSKEVVIRLAPRDNIKSEELGNQLIQVIKEGMQQNVEMRRIEFVGPSVGEELRDNGILAMLVALMCILMYVSMRFEWRFALGSVGALAHDVIITVGMFSFLGLEVDLTVLAAVLAVIGYSLNDTIVVSDRIRENFRKIRKGESQEIIDISLTQTLNRTMITSLTTILVLMALFFVGGELIHGFATALLFGVFIGTYSSIYIASSMALMLGISKEDLIPEVVEKEGADLEP
ncbi:protein translocase subunit SecF [Algicola sagamiensis]|uniref:protein translocase subunit SecF n=1 Tax=Algicola sagamiensis TaxID=163869 RepID=UPI00035F2436|nr:protein translocase subunit SecF [Algicola sagamiensis]